VHRRQPQVHQRIGDLAAAEIGSAAGFLVVLLEEESTAPGVRAVRAGARSVLARQA